MIKHCNCKHDYQDATYGKNNRVHTTTNKGHKCTVCNSVTKIEDSKVKTK